MKAVGIFSGADLAPFYGVSNGVGGMSHTEGNTPAYAVLRHAPIQSQVLQFRGQDTPPADPTKRRWFLVPSLEYLTAEQRDLEVRQAILWAGENLPTPRTVIVEEHYYFLASVRALAEEHDVAICSPPV